MDILIKSVKAIDPKNKVDDVLDVLIKEGKIVACDKNIKEKADKTIDGKGLCLFPGLIDMHTHFREPGFEHQEDIASGSHAALKGGFVACLAMPNTNPPCDNENVVKTILAKSEKAGFNVLPCGTITKQRKGESLSEMAELKEAGCPAVSDDGSFVANSKLMRRAMEYASMLGLIIISHAEDPVLSESGLMNEGYMSTVLGLKGIPNASEDVAVARDIELARLTGVRIHIAHVSTAGAVNLIKHAKKEKIKITCEATPHHIALTDEALVSYDTNLKMKPPLRTKADLEAIHAGLKDGTIDAIATDHAPHQDEEKDKEFNEAPFGVTGLETALGVILTELYHKKVLTLNELVDKMAVTPAKILGLKNFNEIKTGSEANLTLVDIDKEWEVKKEDFVSKSKNSCFLGKKLKGKVVATVCNGKLWEFK